MILLNRDKRWGCIFFIKWQFEIFYSNFKNHFMYRNTGKTNQTESNAAANGFSVNQKTEPKKLQFENNRPEAIAQRKIQKTANNSPQVNKLKSIQALVNSSKNLTQLRTAQPIAATTQPVVQRTPKSWETNDVILRTLALERSGYGADSSTWEKIKSAVNLYVSFSRYDANYNHADHVNDIFLARTNTLTNIKNHIAKWTTDHPVRVWNGDKVISIRAIIPELLNTIKNEEEDIIIEKFGNKFLNERPALVVPPELSEGVATEVGNAAKALKLHQNFNNNLRFRYTGTGVPAGVGLTAHQGDCGTLANIYIDVAATLGIPAVLGDRPGKQLVAAQAIKGRTTTGNTHDQGAWYFQQHFWAVVAGTNYDILFMQTPPPAAIATNGSAEHKGVTYYTFADNRCVIEPNQKNKFNDPAVIKGEGRVFADAAAAQLFIDGNVPG